jgi:hypothetical protein
MEDAITVALAVISVLGVGSLASVFYFLGKGMRRHDG